MEIAGVDLLESERGALVLEVNSSPGLEGIEKASGENVAAAVSERLNDLLRVLGQENNKSISGDQNIRSDDSSKVSEY